MGEGYLSWNRGERSTGRWGTVNLSKARDGNEFTGSVEFENPPVSTYGVLFAEVLETGRSDFHYGLIKEELPKVGDFIVLGEGDLFVEPDDEDPTVQNIGVNPDGEREDDWMNTRSLYRAHQQKVRLYFEDTANIDSWAKYKPIDTKALNR